MAEQRTPELDMYGEPLLEDEDAGDEQADDGEQVDDERSIEERLADVDGLLGLTSQDREPEEATDVDS